MTDLFTPITIGDLELTNPNISQIKRAKPV